MMIKLDIDIGEFYIKGAGPGEALVIRNLGVLHPRNDESIVKASISKSQMMWTTSGSVANQA